MRLFMTLVAPLLGWFTYFLFRLPVAKKSRVKHSFVMKLFRYAADYGSVKALSVYGHLLFFRGDGETNKVQGAIYLERAAEKGDAKAAYQMGKVYEAGCTNFPADNTKAFRLYLQAASAKHILAIRKLVEVYQQGLLEQPVSDEKSEYWCSQQGSEEHS